MAIIIFQCDYHEHVAYSSKKLRNNNNKMEHHPEDYKIINYYFCDENSTDSIILFIFH